MNLSSTTSFNPSRLVTVGRYTGEGVSSFLDGCYIYIDDLKQLASMLPLPLETPPPPEVRRVMTSLKASAWDRLLQDLPDRECAEFVG